MMPRPTPEGTITCVKCGQEKTVAHFYRYKDRGEIYMATCNSCQNERHRDKHFKKKYGVSQAQRAEMFEVANDRCQICGIHRDYATKGTLFIDHDHACCPEEITCGGCIRGLLCHKCNAALGFVGDSIETLESMIDYLRKYDAATTEPSRGVGSGDAE